MSLGKEDTALHTATAFIEFILSHSKGGFNKIVEVQIVLWYFNKKIQKAEQILRKNSFLPQCPRSNEGILFFGESHPLTIRESRSFKGFPEMEKA
jgi:ribosomal protein L1